MPDRDVPLVEEVYASFWCVVENATRGRSDANDSHRFLHALTMRPQIVRVREMHGPSAAQVPADRENPKAPSNLAGHAFESVDRTKSAIDAARCAWNDGYSIIAARLNTVLRKLRIHVRIRAKKAPAGETLGRCRQLLADALIDVPVLSRRESKDTENDDWAPWTVGYVNGDRPKSSSSRQRPFAVGTHTNAIGGAELDQIVKLLETSRQNWTKTEWKENIINPVEQSAKEINQWFDELETRLPPSNFVDAKETPPSYVTLLQAAAMVNKTKSTLERKKPRLPKPDVKGGEGKADEWLWDNLRPALEKEFGRKLPAEFPAARFIRR